MSIIQNLRKRFSRKQEQSQKPQQTKPSQAQKKQTEQQQAPTAQKLDSRAKAKVESAVQSLPERNKMKTHSAETTPSQQTPNTKQTVNKDKPHRSIEQDKRVYDPKIPKERQQAKERDKGRSL